ncbi:hypothetical protein CC80DRAFT_549363 [Byssothecium circinans]|uniref:Uncharacterized protein n=1 Tax=Byssothecium circinans TaxID=147558 RepID=A0A6A5TT32_9PLEO|nr:hypothetical protein CC80DRAFT_549363 [Byssothecium circinans]
MARWRRRGMLERITPPHTRRWRLCTQALGVVQDHLDDKSHGPGGGQTFQLHGLLGVISNTVKDASRNPEEKARLISPEIKEKSYSYAQNSTFQHNQGYPQEPPSSYQQAHEQKYGQSHEPHRGYGQEQGHQHNQGYHPNDGYDAGQRY